MAAYLTAANVRSRITNGSPALDTGRFPDTWVEEVVDEFEELVEEDKRVAFTPRTEVEVIRVPSATDRIKLKWPKVRAIASVVSCGTGSRVVLDGSTASSTSVDSNDADFTSADVGQTIFGAGIPSGATISSRTDENTVVISSAATATATGVTLVIGGTLVSASDYRPDFDRGVLRYDGWFDPFVPVVVTYTHGFDAPPARLLRACALYVERVASLDRSGSTRDVSREGYDSGASTVFIQPDPARGKLTGFIEVDRLLQMIPSYRPAGVA